MKHFIFIMQIISSSLLAMESTHPIKDQLEYIHGLKNYSREEDEGISVLEKLLDENQNQILSVEDLQSLNEKENRRYICGIRSFSKFRVLVDAYLQGGVDGIGRRQEILEKIEIILKKDNARYQKKSLTGRQMLSDYYSPAIVKKAHKSNDVFLIALFTQYLPLPRGFIFDDGIIPEHIAINEKEREFLASEFMSNANDKDEALNCVIYLQRKIRSNIRKTEI